MVSDVTVSPEATIRLKVLACVDNSAAAGPVLAAARAVAPVLGAVVEAVHVIDDGDGTAVATARSRGTPIITLRGDPLALLTAAAAADDVVMVVVGARGLPGRRAGHLMLALANRVDTPVLVVPPDVLPPDRVRRVLIAMEGTRSNARSLKRTIALATDAGLELFVVHVDDMESIPMFSDQAVYETEAYATEFLARYVRGAPAAKLELRVGDPVDEILKATDTVEPDIVAIGWRQDDDPTRAAVAHELLAHTHVPLLLVALQA